VIAAEEGTETEPLGGGRHGEEVVVGRALLRLGEHTKIGDGEHRAEVKAVRRPNSSPMSEPNVPRHRQAAMQSTHPQLSSRRSWSFGGPAKNAADA